jgi:hypothetical protein
MNGHHPYTNAYFGTQQMPFQGGFVPQQIRHTVINIPGNGFVGQQQFVNGAQVFSNVQFVCPPTVHIRIDQFGRQWRVTTYSDGRQEIVPFF